MKPFWEAGFTHVALVQIGGDHQEEFFTAANERILPALREAAGSWSASPDFLCVGCVPGARDGRTAFRRFR